MTGDVTSGTRVRIRQPMVNRLLLLPSLLLMVWATLLLDEDRSQWASMIVLVLALAGVQWWFGVTLTPDELVSHALRPRRVRWSQVQAVVPRLVLGVWVIEVWTADQERIRLRAPVSNWLGTSERAREGAFRRDFHLIGQWWLAHRGADWRQLW